jgi:hypothetical protein
MLLDVHFWSESEGVLERLALRQSLDFVCLCQGLGRRGRVLPVYQLHHTNPRLGADHLACEYGSLRLLDYGALPRYRRLNFSAKYC